MRIIVSWEGRELANLITSLFLMTFLSVVLGVNMVTCAALPVTTDGCDWIGSGLENMKDSRSVRPVYLRCTQGHVEWRYPQGGLRVLFHRPYHFRLCIKGYRTFRGARVFVEGQGELYPFYWRGDGKDSSLPRCWSSTAGQLALYVEAEPTNVSSFGLSTHVAGFSYDLQKVKKEDMVDSMADCRPCSEEEMLRAFCTSDFVARGRIMDIANNEQLQRTELTVQVRKVYHQNEQVFGDTDTGVVYTPLKCHARRGLDEYVVMGRMKLGEPVLQCAPTLKEWTRARRRADKEGTAQCIMDN